MCLIHLLRQGGWEIDETAGEAACREAMEEAGVKGILNVSISNFLFDEMKLV